MLGIIQILKHNPLTLKPVRVWDLLVVTLKLAVIFITFTWNAKAKKMIHMEAKWPKLPTDN